MDFIIRLRLLMLLRPTSPPQRSPTAALPAATIAHLARGAELADLPYLLGDSGNVDGGGGGPPVPPPGVTLLGGELLPAVARPAYVVGLDHRSGGRPFVAIRGTASVRDVLTNLHMGVVAPSVRPTASPPGVAVHAGYDASASALAPRVARLLAAHAARGGGRARAASGTPPGVLVVGHSLGGAVASLLALRLRAAAPAAGAVAIEVLSYGSAAVATAGLARWSARPATAMTAVVCGADAVPRLSLASLDRLASAVAAAELGEELRARLLQGLPETLATLAGGGGGGDSVREGVARHVSAAWAGSSAEEAGGDGAAKDIDGGRGGDGGDSSGGGGGGGGGVVGVRSKATVASEVQREEEAATAGTVDAAVGRLDDARAVELYPMGALVHVTGAVSAAEAPESASDGAPPTSADGPTRELEGATGSFSGGDASGRHSDGGGSDGHGRDRGGDCGLAVFRGDLLRDLTDVVPHERMIADHLLDAMITTLRGAADAAAAAEAGGERRRG